MRIFNPKWLMVAVATTSFTIGLTGCNDSKSYAERLTDENHAINKYLLNQHVIMSVPSDSVFETGPDAPFYCLDEDQNVYMQVINPGTPDNRVTDNQLVYFRFTRWNIKGYDPYTNTFADEGWGNSDDMSVGAASFRYGNYTLESSTQWGSGLQMPLAYLGIDSEVNLIIKSQYGLSSEISQVLPYLYNVRYFPAVSE